MIDDFVGRQRPALKKTKTITPLEKPTHEPLPTLESEDTVPEPDFKPPEIVAEQSDDSPQTTTSGFGTSGFVGAGAPKKSKPSFGSWKWPLGKKATILAAVLAVLLIGGGTTAALMTHKPTKNVVSYIKTPAKPKPVAPPVIYSNLSGLPVADASINQRPVTGVMIENSDDARPQSGMNQAGVIFEAIAEGGITRFLTLYQDQQPDYLGPVRSARPYYVQWCMGFDCSLAHVGGSPEALADIPAWGTKNLDQFANAGAFERITSRYAPHNVYTSTAQLSQLETSKGYGASSFTGFPRKSDKPYVAPATAPPAASTKPSTTKIVPDTRTPATAINFAISGVDFNSVFNYDAPTDSYKRSQAGAPHMVLNKDGSKVQLQPKVVVAMVMQYGLEADDHHSQYNVIGSGQAFVFQDGTETAATWTKSDMKSPLTFTDTAGQPIAFNRGQTWLTALGAAGQATYK